MQEAKQVSTGNIIDAEDLPTLKISDPYDFECPDINCNKKYTACSYKPENSNRPYFKASERTKEHNVECLFHILESLKSKAKKVSVTVNGRFPVPYPSKLELISEQEETGGPEAGSVPIHKVPFVRGRAPKNIDEVKKAGKRVVVTLNQIVDQFLDFPYDRDLEIDLPTLGKIPYKFAFKKISYKYNHKKYSGYRVYYGKVIFKDDLKVDQNLISLKLLECENWITNKENKKEQLNPYILKIDVTNWSEYHLKKVLRKISGIKQDEKDNYGDEKNHKSAYIFFFTEAPTEYEPFEFKINNPRLIEAKYTEIISS